ncbi:leucyl aminopeptidase [Paramagnetospirillum marisnigri]|uniref:Leucyl aminopeptidase n=1 Tax=Paramagnetospirillum marisnigri TaxID=1285242 RepID=A0A178MYG6_9PROT|nr:leucyl aminopeptidase family protein [Paramagnetospirillum marisnigri]OAN54629.1 leucyl aminopeptidase [Paramagnetospirillum marisnigri]
MPEHLIEADAQAIEITALRKSELSGWLDPQPDRLRGWIKATGFCAEPGSVCLVPGEDGGLDRVLFGLAEDADLWAYAALPAKLPAGAYRLSPEPPPPLAERAALGWALATYAYERYKSKAAKPPPRLVWPESCDRARVEAAHDAIALVRDLVNTPASDMGPAELTHAAERLAARFGAQCRVVVGDGLLAENYPAIHAVGRAAASHRRPRLADLTWGDEANPRLTLVGKGVCFDTGGLDLKPSSNMKLMKKDMGGAAHVLGLASMIMAARLPVRLRVLIPAVENSVSGDAMRPLDVLATRKGLTVEIGNTDAEGRLILADALFEASRDKPKLLIDFATLTGAARSALGPDLPALFTDNEQLARTLLDAGDAESDPLWRLPLHKPYRRMLDSKVADLVNASDSPHAGAITAALFLQEFVDPDIAWAHLDVLAWNGSSRPGRPEGGEAQGLRAVFAAIAKLFPAK